MSVLMAAVRWWAGMVKKQSDGEERMGPGGDSGGSKVWQEMGCPSMAGGWCPH